MVRQTETWTAKLLYGFGALAYGVKDNAFQVFLLFYYFQVVGMPEVYIGAAILIAILIDAVTDPLVGQFSDNLRTRIGRRHPLMFAAALPVAVAFYYLWHPPEGLSDEQLFFYVLGFASLTRILITFYEIPSTALVSDLTQDYNQRIKFQSARYFFAWLGGAGLGMVAYATFFASTDAYPNGLMDPDGYSKYALLGAGLMLVSTLVSAGGTLRYLPHLVPDKSSPIVGVKDTFKSLYAALTDKIFAPLFINAILGAMAFGISVSLSLFLNTYFWEFTSEQLVTLSFALLIGAGIAPFVAPLAARGRLDKRSAAIRLAIVAIILIPSPIILRLLGWFPENGSEALIWMIFLHQVAVISIGIGAEILVSAMVADVVEDNQRRTGRRRAGVFFAARTFAAKSTNGLGLFIGSLIVAAAGLEKGMAPADATPEMVDMLGILYAPIIIAIYVVAVFMLTRFKITRQRHLENLAALRSHAPND